MDTKNFKQLIRAIVLSQLSYFPFVWMSYDRALSHKIYHADERARCFAYKDFKNYFDSLLRQFGLVSFDLINLLFILIGIITTKFELNRPFMKYIFHEARYYLKLKACR